MPTIERVKVKSVKYIGKADVYNMEVDRHHNFSINGGIIVHNCYDGLTYGICAYHASKSKALEPEKNKMQQYKEKRWKEFKQRDRRH